METFTHAEDTDDFDKDSKVHYRPERVSQDKGSGSDTDVEVDLEAAKRRM